jgi:hypothetical protein
MFPLDIEPDCMLPLDIGPDAELPCILAGFFVPAEAI